MSAAIFHEPSINLAKLKSLWEHRSQLTQEERNYVEALLRIQERGYRTNKYISTLRPHLVPGHKKDNIKQRLFLGCDDMEVFAGGAGGGGKTDVLLLSALRYCDEPKYSSILIMDTYQNLKGSGAALDRAKEWFTNRFPQVRFSGSEYSFKFPAEWNERHIAKKRNLLFDEGEENAFKLKRSDILDLLGPPPNATMSFGYLAHAEDKYKYKCLTPDHEILTKQGWMPIDVAWIGDEVATMNPLTRQMEYQKIAARYEYNYKGEMESLYQRFGLSYVATPNHTVWASSWNKIRRRGDNSLSPYRADSLPKTACVPQFVKPFVGGTSPDGMIFTSDGHNGRTIRFTSEQWVVFLGWFVTEGNTEYGRWEVRLSQKKTVGRDQIRTLLESVGCNFCEHENGFSFNNKAICLYLSENCGNNAYNKKLPIEFREWDLASRRLLLSTLIDGDGCRMDGERWVRFTTASPFLRDDISELAFLCGYRPTFSEQHGSIKNGYGDRINYAVSLLLMEQDTQVNGAKRERVHYEGKVYCLEVPPHNTFVIRHRGRVSITGNSKEYQTVLWDELSQQARESDYTYLFSRLRRLEWSDVPLQSLSASNPGGPGHIWVRDRFVPEEYHEKTLEEKFGRVWYKIIVCGECDGTGVLNNEEFENEHCFYCNGKGERRRVFIPARAKDNPSLDVKAYRISLSEMTDIERARMERGDWSVMVQGELFKSHWFRYYSRRGDHFILSTGPDTPDIILDRQRCSYFITMDTASKTKTQNDYTVIAQWVMDRRAYNLVLVDLVREKMEVPAILPALMAMYSKYPNDFAMIEDASSGIGVIQEARSARGKGISIKSYSPHTGDVVSRATPAIIRCEAGQVYFPSSSPHWLAEFENELVSFDGDADKHDDQVAVLSMAADYVNNLHKSEMNRGNAKPEQVKPGIVKGQGSLGIAQAFHGGVGGF